MLEIIKAIIYGIVEGITEWLPISSTGHLILVERLIPFQQTSEGFFDMFDVVIQLGAILAVVVLFWNKIWPFYLKKNKQPKKGGIVKSAKDPAVGNVALSMDAFWMWDVSRQSYTVCYLMMRWEKPSKKRSEAVVLRSRS